MQPLMINIGAELFGHCLGEKHKILGGTHVVRSMLGDGCRIGLRKDFIEEGANFADT